MDTPLATSEFAPVSTATAPHPATLHSSPDRDVRTHVLTTAATRRMPNPVPQPALAAAAPPAASLLDGMLVQLAGPALVAAGLVRLLYRAEWATVVGTPESLASSELWSAVLADVGVVGLLVCLWVAAWRRAYSNDRSRSSSGWDFAALMLFIPVLGLSWPSICLATVGLSAMLTTFAALFVGVAGGGRSQTESRWGEAAFGSFQVVLVAMGLAAGGTSLAAGIALCAAALVAAMGAATLGVAEEAASAH